MHEISLVRNIFNTLEAEFQQQEVEKISEIHLKVGVLSNVEPILMQNAFEAVTSTENRFQQAKLLIEVIPIEIQCPECQQISGVEQYKFVCKHCGTPTNNIIKGEELLIERIVFEE